MGVFDIAGSIEEREAKALAHYRASKRVQERVQENGSQQQRTRLQEQSGGQRPQAQDRNLQSAASSRRRFAGRLDAPVSYTVQRGDTLDGIAEWFYGDRGRWLSIHTANRHAIRDLNSLAAGTVLTIPPLGDDKSLA